MIDRVLKTSAFFFGLCIATQFVYASQLEDRIPCPSLDIIQQGAQKIDTAMDYQNAYLVYASTPIYKDSRLGWSVGVRGIKASSEQEAIEQGKRVVQNATVRKQEYAKRIRANIYSCHYGPADILAVGSPDALIMKFASNF